MWASSTSSCAPHLEPKTLGRAVLVGQEGLEHLAPSHAVEDLKLLLLVELGLQGKEEGKTGEGLLYSSDT